MNTITSSSTAVRCFVATWLFALPYVHAEVTEEQVLRAINQGKKYLVEQQQSDGAWRHELSTSHEIGVTSLVLMSLIQSGMTIDDPPIKRGLQFLRESPEPEFTYDISLEIMAFAAAKDGKRDIPRVRNLVRKLEKSQVKSESDTNGLWTYTIHNSGNPDRSNGQFAVLGLREAQHMGVAVSRETWERVLQQWQSTQAGDGGWSYVGPRQGGGSYGSMTVAGIATLIIAQSMLPDGVEEDAQGNPICCGNVQEDEHLKRAIKWLDSNFAIGHNPRYPSWLLYYLYGLERAGRFSGQRFFGDHDWYREGADFLLKGQSRGTGLWKGHGLFEDRPIVGTALSLLFLSKGLSPVIINKLKFGPENPETGEVDLENWNIHRNDIRNLTDIISGLPDWPKLVTWQEVDIAKAVEIGNVSTLAQAPIVYLTGKTKPEFTEQELALLKEYVLSGGCIVAVAGCDGTEFDEGFRALIRRMYPEGDHQLKRLTAEHPVFRSEYLLDPLTTELWGVDVGCRTSIIYSPVDIGCLWDRWAVVDPPKRSAQMKERIAKATKTGVNIVAYAIGREPPSKLQQPSLLAGEGRQEQIEKGLLQIAKIRHSGGWDTAPQAVRNLLMALNAYGGVSATTKPKNIVLTDPGLFRYPLIYMHGRSPFDLSASEKQKLKDHLLRGGMLFADACCGSPQFDRAFRELCSELFPDNQLTRIPPDHEMFTTAIGHDLKTVKRREPEVDNTQATIRTKLVEGEPYLEGIQVQDRFVVIYSKYDISCALEKQAALTCTGYEHEDAVKIAVNIVLYSLLQ